MAAITKVLETLVTTLAVPLVDKVIFLVAMATSLETKEVHLSSKILALAALVVWISTARTLQTLKDFK